MCRFGCRQLVRTTQKLHSSANLLPNMAPGTMQYGFKSVCVRCKAVPSPAVRSFSRLCAATVMQGHHLHTPMSELEGIYRIQALCAAHTDVHTFSSKNGLCIAVYKPRRTGTRWTPIHREKVHHIVLFYRMEFCAAMKNKVDKSWYKNHAHAVVSNYHGRLETLLIF